MLKHEFKYPIAVNNIYYDSLNNIYYDDLKSADLDNFFSPFGLNQYYPHIGLVSIRLRYATSACLVLSTGT